MTDTSEFSVHQGEIHPVTAIGWFTEHTNLRGVHPDVAHRCEGWAVMNTDDIIALALVEGGHLRRIGVREGWRREGVASTLVDYIHDEHGPLEAECRKSLDANEFYAATGWERDGVRPGDPEDLVVWQYDGE